MKVQELSSPAVSALLATEGRRGAVPPSVTTSETLIELRAAGLLGDGNGLTDSGVTHRAVLTERLLDSLFGGL